MVSKVSKRAATSEKDHHAMDEVRVTNGFKSAEMLLERARNLARSSDQEELRDVGRTCEEIIISLAQALYVGRLHEPKVGAKPGASPKRRLECYLEVELSGVQYAGARALAKSSLDSA